MVYTRDNRDSRSLHHLTSEDLIPHFSYCLWCGTYKGYPIFQTCFGELMILSKKPVTGVYCICPPLFGKINNPVNIQISCYRPRADKTCLISLFYIKGGSICLRMNGNCRDIKLLTGADPFNQAENHVARSHLYAGMPGGYD